jgi:hypothetical protein
MPFTATLRPFHREKDGVHAMRWHKRANQGRSVSGATLAPFAAERVVPRFRYQYHHRVLPPKEKRSGGTTPADASFAGMIKITKLVHFSVAGYEYRGSNVTTKVGDCIMAM